MKKRYFLLPILLIVFLLYRCDGENLYDFYTDNANYSLSFDPPAGAYSSDVSVTITTDVAGAEIHYTTDGSDPAPESALYTAPIQVLGDGTSVIIKAVLVKDGSQYGDIREAFYSINYSSGTTLNAPSITPASGVYDTGTLIRMSGDYGTSIYYTTDGSVPDAGSAVYSGSIKLVSPFTLKAVSIGGSDVSSVSQESYTVNNLLIWYKLDGNSLDSTSNGWNGTETGAPSTAAGHTGAANSAYQFTSAQYIEVTASSFNSRLTGNFTLCAWIYLNSFANDNIIMAKHTTDGSAESFANFIFKTDLSPKINLVMGVGGGGAVVTALGTTSLALNTWYHVAAAFDGTTLELFINGASDGTVAFAGTRQTGASPFRIGYLQTAMASYFDGRIDQARVYNEALTASQILAIYQSGE